MTKKLIAILIAAAALFSLAACGSAEQPAEAKEVDLGTVYQSFTEIMPDMFTLDEATLLNFLGIESSDCKQVIVATCVNGLRTDEVWLIEAKDADALERLLALAETRLEAKRGETISYAPDQYAIVEKAELITEGMYLALIVSPDATQLKSVFEEAMK